MPPRDTPPRDTPRHVPPPRTPPPYDTLPAVRRPRMGMAIGTGMARRPGREQDLPSIGRQARHRPAGLTGTIGRPPPPITPPGRTATADSGPRAAPWARRAWVRRGRRGRGAASGPP